MVHHCTHEYSNQQERAHELCRMPRWQPFCVVRKEWVSVFKHLQLHYSITDTVFPLTVTPPLTVAPPSFGDSESLTS